MMPLTKERDKRMRPPDTAALTAVGEASSGAIWRAISVTRSITIPTARNDCWRIGPERLEGPCRIEKIITAIDWRDERLTGYHPW
jgi:hypothetical protein